MQNKKTFITILAAFVIVMIGAVVVYNSLSNDASVNVGSENASPAADFTVTDPKGNKVSLSDMKGTPVILNFWASWCGPCQSEMPAFEEAYAEYKDKINFMMVNMTGDGETVQSAKDFIESNGYTFPVYFDTEENAASAYEVYAIPATYFINADGKVEGYTKGAIDKNALLDGIKTIYQ